MWGSAYAIDLKRRLSTYCRYKNNDITNPDDKNQITGENKTSAKIFYFINKAKVIKDLLLFFVTECFKHKVL